MFTANDIRSRVQQKPFIPFRLVMSSGEKYEVKHPELVLVGLRDLVIGAPSAADPDLYDRLSRVAILHITDLQDMPVSTSPTGNGQS